MSGGFDEFLTEVENGVIGAVLLLAFLGLSAFVVVVVSAFLL